jgi:hypothetical protein
LGIRLGIQREIVVSANGSRDESSESDFIPLHGTIDTSQASYIGAIKRSFSSLPTLPITFFARAAPPSDTGQSAAPQLRNVIAATLQLSESRAFEVPDNTLRYPGHDEKMSDIQQYLLDFDRNKKEATTTAQRSATRMYEVPAGHLVG